MRQQPRIVERVYVDILRSAECGQVKRDWKVDGGEITQSRSTQSVRRNSAATVRQRTTYHPRRKTPRHERSTGVIDQHHGVVAREVDNMAGSAAENLRAHQHVNHRERGRPRSVSGSDSEDGRTTRPGRRAKAVDVGSRFGSSQVEREPVSELSHPGVLAIDVEALEKAAKRALRVRVERNRNAHNHVVAGKRSGRQRGIHTTLIVREHCTPGSDRDSGVATQPARTRVVDQPHTVADAVVLDLARTRLREHN